MIVVFVDSHTETDKSYNHNLGTDEGKGMGESTVFISRYHSNFQPHPHPHPRKYTAYLQTIQCKQ
jgi:hypothetical protein